MEPTARLFQCRLCRSQAVICSKCDHGQIYCSDACSTAARVKSMKLAGARYQATFIGKRNHAARQARYRKHQNQLVTHHSSTLALQCASMLQLENNAKKIEIDHGKIALICCFCHKPVSAWFRNDFLQRRNSKKIFRLAANPQAP